jgi:RimJ/RimL family protein N-acetyltransferase
VELRDDDIVLRPPAPEDADSVVPACNDDEIARFIPLMPTPYEPVGAAGRIERCVHAWQTGGACP